jgi:hypothetical protein
MHRSGEEQGKSKEESQHDPGKSKEESQHECFPDREPDYYVKDASQDYLHGVNALLRARGS